MPLPNQPTAYSWLMLAAIFVSGCLMWRMRRRNAGLLSVYLVTLAGAFFGAKVVYLAAEGWLYAGHPDKWRIWLTGKTILGALLFGYPFAEWAKRFFGYEGTTGDFFALAVIPGIIIGRIGCLTQGCCAGAVCEPACWTLRDAAGMDRWPSVPVEIAFNLVALSVVFTLHRAGKLKGQLFHFYLMACGVFRFAHEFVRDTPRVLGPFSGYHFAAAGVFALGLLGFLRRARTMSAAVSSAARGRQ